jgi:hypothetical protein
MPAESGSGQHPQNHGGNEEHREKMLISALTARHIQSQALLEQGDNIVPRQIAMVQIHHRARHSEKHGRFNDEKYFWTIRDKCTHNESTPKYPHSISIQKGVQSDSFIFKKK